MGVVTADGGQLSFCCTRLKTDERSEEYILHVPLY